MPSEEFGNKYPEHGRPAYAANPYMLRSVTALNQYDPLCRTCHGSSAPLVKGSNPVDNDVRLDPATSHADGAPIGSGGSGPIVEDDGTPLKATAGAAATSAAPATTRTTRTGSGSSTTGTSGSAAPPALETAIDASADCT